MGKTCESAPNRSSALTEKKNWNGWTRLISEKKKAKQRRKYPQRRLCLPCFSWLRNLCSPYHTSQQAADLVFEFQSFEASNRGQFSCRCTLDQWLDLIGVISSWETKYFKQEPIQRRFDFSDVLYFGWPNQPSSGTMRVYIELLLCTYIYIVNGCWRNTGKNVIKHGSYKDFEFKY